MLSLVHAPHKKESAIIRMAYYGAPAETLGQGDDLIASMRFEGQLLIEYNQVRAKLANPDLAKGFSPPI